MDHKKPTRKGPPMFFRKLLRWFCSDDLLEELEGDLEETFEFNRAHRGTRYAQFAYVKEVLSLVRPSVIKKLNYNNNSTIMISNYGKVAVRNFAKNKTYVLINMLSMGIGMACCIVSFLNYEHNNTFDHQHGNIENIYRVNYEQQDGKYLRNYGVVPSAIAEEAGELANVKEVTQYIEWHGNAKIKEDYFDLNMGYVSDNFLDVFTFPVIR
ncbi:MAG: permease prefix domain 2-containing transporter, partial [Bacteroidota bacterium]